MCQPLLVDSKPDQLYNERAGPVWSHKSHSKKVLFLVNSEPLDPK